MKLFDTDGFSILAMLKKLNIKANLIRKREKNDYTKLLDHEIDLYGGYLTNESYYFKERNIDINIIDPSNYGFDLYGDMIFTNENEATNHPQRVEKFREASLKGWEYALNHKEEIIELINKKYSNKSIEHLRFEANVIEKMINKDVIPLGTTDEGRFQYTYDLYKEYGLSNSDLNVKNFIGSGGGGGLAPGSGGLAPGNGGFTPGKGGWLPPGKGGFVLGNGGLELGIGGWALGIGGCAPGIGGRDPGIGGRDPGIGGRERGMGGWDLGVGGWNPGRGPNIEDLEPGNSGCWLFQLF